MAQAQQIDMFWHASVAAVQQIAVLGHATVAAVQQIIIFGMLARPWWRHMPGSGMLVRLRCSKYQYSGMPV